MVAEFRGRNNGLPYRLKIKPTEVDFDVLVFSDQRGAEEVPIGEYSFNNRTDLLGSSNEPQSIIRDFGKDIQFCWSGWLFVQENHRGEGICPRLIDFGIEELKRRGGLHLVRFNEDKKGLGGIAFSKRGYAPFTRGEDPRYATFFRLYD